MKPLITQDEIEKLPEDPQLRFSGIVEICTKRYSDYIEGQDENYSIIESYRLRYMGYIIAAAKAFEIPTIKDLSLPTVRDFQTEDFREFEQTISFYVMQIMVQGAERKSKLV